MKTQERTQEGFTLVELLTTIAVVGILASMIALGLRGAWAKAQRTKCSSNIRQITIAIETFTIDRAAFPNWREWDVVARDVVGIEDRDYTVNVFDCPAVRKPSEWTATMPSYAWREIGYNYWGVGGGTDTEEVFGLGAEYPNTEVRVNVTQVKQPAAMILTGDGVSGDQGLVWESDVLGRRGPLGPNLPVRGMQDRTLQRIVGRHNGRLNIAFVDGHVEAMELTTLFNDTSDAALRLWNRDHKPHRERL